MYGTSCLTSSLPRLTLSIIPTSPAGFENQRLTTPTFYGSEDLKEKEADSEIRGTATHA